MCIMRVKRKFYARSERFPLDRLAFREDIQLCILFARREDASWVLLEGSSAGDFRLNVKGKHAASFVSRWQGEMPEIE